MTRPSLLNKLSNAELSLGDVWGWYEFQLALVNEEKSRVFDALLTGGNFAGSRYVGKVREELNEDFTFQTAELRQMSMLGMLAATEAALRVDFFERVGNKRKDDVSRRFRDANRRRGIDKIRLEEDILDTWKERGPNAAIKSTVAEFRGALNLRHWLAHGRYWKPKLGRASGYDPVDILDICRELLLATEILPP